MLLENGADPNIPCLNGKTALFYAVLVNCYQLVKAMIEQYKAKTALICNDEQTVLHYYLSASHDPDLQIIEIFCSS